ncbi:ULP_PROTEASE domain-containing protein [Raphanus sativus]|nr:ULP_PROTEASE domain-containing protein [Raphanus sativus]
MKPPKPAPPKITDPLAWLVKKLKQSSFRLQGFPLTLQLVAFRAIPQLLQFIPAPNDDRTLMDLEQKYLPQHGSIKSNDILRVEFSENLAFSPVIPMETQPQPGWGEWPNKTKDDRLIYMEQLISDGCSFNKAMWPGGLTTETLLHKPQDRGNRTVKPNLTRVKQSLRPKPFINKDTSTRKQRRISSYFTRSKANIHTNEELTEIVLGLQQQINDLKKLLKNKKRKARGRQSSFNTLLYATKKLRTSTQEEERGTIQQDTPATQQTGDQPADVNPLHFDPKNDQDRDDQEEPHSPIISQYAAHLQREASENAITPPYEKHTEIIHNKSVHTANFDDTTEDEDAEAEQVEPVFIKTIRPTTMLSEMTTDLNNSDYEKDVQNLGPNKPADPELATDEHNVVAMVAEAMDSLPKKDVHNSREHYSQEDEQAVYAQDADKRNQVQDDVNNSKEQDQEILPDDKNYSGQGVDDGDDLNEMVHNTPDHKIEGETQPIRITDDATADANETADTKQNTTQTRTFGTLYPGRWDPPSKVYDKADHPNSPEINHILHHGMTIYDPISPDPPLSAGPIFDQTAGPSSPTGIRLHLSPITFTPLTSPVKSNESGLGFASHAGTPNAFKATASSNSPPSIGRQTNAEENQPADDSTIDLTSTKDPPSHVPTHLENLLAKELISSPLVPALDLITPLPDREWEIFNQVLKTNINVFHSTPSEFEFSNKSLLEMAKPKQWTTTYQMEILVHMISKRHADILQTEKAAFAPPILCSAIEEDFQSFTKCGKKKKESFEWDQRLVDIVLCPGKKWMEDIHTIYTPMLWDESHWVGLAINLDMGLVEVLDPLPTLHGVRRMAKWMKPILASLPYLVKKVAMCELTQFAGVKPFVCTRITDIYVNHRSGDCGPVTMKFLELHAHGDPPPGMAGITDKIVDNIRMQFAMDIYKTLVLPAYYA